MRLLNVHTFEFHEYRSNVPRYAIASHRWSEGNEATMQDLTTRNNTDKIGYKKVEGFAKYIREYVGYVDWLWIDTCCVNQDSSQEVTEAVNSMFLWYAHAELCLAYLGDVNNAKDEDEFRKSDWFRRGWTLQELLAPAIVVFLSQGWEVIGRKGYDGYTTSKTCATDGPSLEPTIAAITKIPERVLHDYHQSKSLSVDERLAWIIGRDTTRKEDLSYSLLGIFDITMPIVYGEGGEKARERLLRKISKAAAKEVDRYKKIVDWLSPPDPWTNHASARRLYEPNTGSWLLHSDQFRRWKDGVIRHIWLYGKAGCGKTVLTSTVVEEIQMYCEDAVSSASAVFYFSFSDSRKQSFESLLCSLVAQLGWKEPVLSMLQRESDRPNRRLPAPEALEEILLLSMGQFDSVLLTLDALDECPEREDTRRDMLNCLERLSRKAPNLSIFAASRELRDIHDCMSRLEAEILQIDTRPVDTDIGRYISNELSRDWKLNRLDNDTKALIMEKFANRADGMFRWAYCQLQELKKLKSSKPKYIKKALLSLPLTLDATYERMLLGIEEMFHAEALTLLRWLAYSKRLLTLEELTEASIISPDADGIVDFANRGLVEDTLDILSGLITVEGNEDLDDNERVGSDRKDSNIEETRSQDLQPIQHISKRSKVRLAHFSVQEYLESDRITWSEAKFFHLEKARDHYFLAQSCLTYILHYSGNGSKTSTDQDLLTFPLIQYAAQSWYHHSLSQSGRDISREVRLLDSRSSRRDWLLVHTPDGFSKRPFREDGYGGEGLYYACFLGLQAVVGRLLTARANVKALGRVYGTALQAASSKGHLEIVKMLLERGADVNAKGGAYGNAMQAAAENGHEQVVDMLAAWGADIDAWAELEDTCYIQGGHLGNALQAASIDGHEKVVEVLLKRGAEVNAEEEPYGNALQAAVEQGHEKIVKLLVDGGANINAQLWDEEQRHYNFEEYYGNALQAASHMGNVKIVEILMDGGADANAQGGDYGNALSAAISESHWKVAEMLIERGADVNARGGPEDPALVAASIRGSSKAVEMLIDAGADVNGQDADGSSALHVASELGHEKIAELLLDRGADVNAQGGEYGSALQAASFWGKDMVVEILIERGADVNAPGGRCGNALRAALLHVDTEKVVKILRNAGANVNA